MNGPKAPIVGAGREPAALRRYLLGGNTLVTLKNTLRNTEVTFAVQFDGTWPARVWVPGQGGQLQPLGHINQFERFFTLGRSPFPKGSPKFLAFDWLWKQVKNGQHVSDAIEIWHHGKCCRCSRDMWRTESLDRGFGPTCWSHIHKRMALDERIDEVIAALDEGILLEGMPAGLANMEAGILAKLLALLGADDIDAWAQARELAGIVAPEAMLDFDGVIAERLRVINGGAAKKELAAATAGATLDPFWMPTRIMKRWADLAAK